MNSLKDRAIIIIRSAGERTEQVCRELILDQGIDPSNVITLRVSPFSAAVRKSFEIGIERKLPWTFCVDADLLLRPSAIQTMLQLAEEQRENICEIQGYVLDKFYGGPRMGGVHVYRTSLLPLALSCIPAEGVDIRPEAHTLVAMKALGYPWVTVPYLVGLHDFEQYHRDIFRKCFVHARKHLTLAELFISGWRERAALDADYRVALRAFADGIQHYGDVLIDVEQSSYKEGFSKHNLVEKQALVSGSYSLETVEKCISDWVEPSLYREKYPTKMGLLPVKKQIVAKVRELGMLKIIPYTFAWLLTRLGKLIIRWTTTS